MCFNILDRLNLIFLSSFAMKRFVYFFCMLLNGKKWKMKTNKLEIRKEQNENDKIDQRNRAFLVKSMKYLDYKIRRMENHALVYLVDFKNVAKLN